MTNNNSNEFTSEDWRIIVRHNSDYPYSSILPDTWVTFTSPGAVHNGHLNIDSLDGFEVLLDKVIGAESPLASIDSADIGQSIYNALLEMTGDPLKYYHVFREQLDGRDRLNMGRDHNPFFEIDVMSQAYPDGVATVTDYLNGLMEKGLLHP
jgi:hypothetical protein